MKKIGFVGACDKTDLIMYVAKILVELKENVLVVDTTVLQKTRYTVTSIEPSRSYITTYEGIDVAVGFTDLGDIEHYIGEQLNYDMVLINIDRGSIFKKMGLASAERNFFVTTMESYSLKRGLEIIEEIRRET